MAMFTDPPPVTRILVVLGSEREKMKKALLMAKRFLIFELDQRIECML